MPTESTPTRVRTHRSTARRRRAIDSFATKAVELYKLRTKNYDDNLQMVTTFMYSTHPDSFAPLLTLCPTLPTILSHMLIIRFGFYVGDVSWTSDITKWSDEDAKKVGRSMAYLFRMVQTGDAAVDSWRSHYPQLNELFENVEGFEEFMVVIVNSLLRDSQYGMMFRVGTGAVLSTLDGVTDIYTITTYFKNDLSGRALALLLMISVNLAAQLLIVNGQNQKQGWRIKLREASICLFFLKPAFDAYRLSTNSGGDDGAVDSLAEMTAFKFSEMAFEAVPGCILQLYVYFINPDQAGTYALVSIAISALTTGFTSAIVAYDFDVDVSRRKNQPKIYGYIPDDNSLRGRCFVLMTLISALHNISRSVGMALLAVTSRRLVFIFVGGELGLYFAYKIIRRDFFWWPRFDSKQVAVGIGATARLIAKVVADYTGCLHLRHPYELGGAAFSLSMVWAQLFPFVALWLWEEGGVDLDEDLKRTITIVLVGCFGLWVVLNLIFFCTIDLSYVNTFFGTMTAPQYTCKYFKTSEEDFQKWDAAFDNRIYFTETIRDEVKAWVAANVEEWMMTEPDFFKIEMIPDEFLPPLVLAEEGGSKRRRSSIGMFEHVKKSVKESVKEPRKHSDVNSAIKIRRAKTSLENREEWEEVAKTIYSIKTNNHKHNLGKVKNLFAENKELLAPLNDRCKKFYIILSVLLTDRFFVRIRSVDRTIDINDWNDEQCERVGHALTTLVRTRHYGAAAIEGWRIEFPQLSVLFDEIPGFHDFVLHIANKKAKDSIYGTVYRVTIGALLSTSDIITDIYVVATYYKTPALHAQANALIVMFAINFVIQLVSIIGLYEKKSKGTKVKEVLISLFFLRPIVDAYRLVKNEVDDIEKPVDQLSEMIVNKGIEMAAEGVPGCVLQLYVWLSSPQDAGTFALMSITISALTTGYTSAIISFSFDTDKPHRANQPLFYGYIKNRSGQRGRAFILMTLISTLHNLSRSLGCALLVAGGGKRMAAFFLGGEMLVYLLSKILRGDFFWFPRIESKRGALAVSLAQRIAVKIITDFTGCLHFRHPYELGAITFSISMMYAQIFPFVAFFLYGDEISEDEGVKKRILVFLIGSLSAWLLLSILFFKTIDTSYIKTFFGTMTAPQYTCNYFKSSNEDFQKWDAFVENRIDYSTAIHPQIKEWVAENIGRWNLEKPEWFKVEKIPDEFLPAGVLAAAGGAGRRRRSSVSLREVVGLEERGAKVKSSQVHPEAPTSNVANDNTTTSNEIKEG